MPKNQNKPKTKKYRRDLNHAEFLDNIEFFSIILKNQIILVYDPPADGRFNYLLLLLNGVNADLLAGLAVALKLNSTVYKSEESIIRADTYIVTGMNFCASLSYKDIACKNELTVSSLGAESLGFGITAVTG